MGQAGGESFRVRSIGRPEHWSGVSGAIRASCSPRNTVSISTWHSAIFA